MYTIVFTKQFFCLYSLRQMFRNTFQKTQHVALNAQISTSNRYYSFIMLDYVVVLIYDLCMTLFFLFPAQ